MKKLTGNEIRQMFIDYFKAKDHMVEPSAPLVPIDDDSLLWINSGVATLKKYFDGRVRSEEHTSELQSRGHLVCRLLLEKKKQEIKELQSAVYKSNRRLAYLLNDMD